MKHRFITGLFLAGALAAPAPQEKCAPGPHIITVRESSAPPDGGFVRDLANEVQAKLNESDIESDIEDVDYPAWFVPYVHSETEGVKKAREAIENYVESCPQTDIILLGYSQGAHAIGDVLCGTNNPLFGKSDPLPTANLGDHVKAVVLMGDPGHEPGVSFDVGTSTKPGLFHRFTDIECPGYSDKIQSYCDSNDPFCDRGLNQNVHNGYIKEYGDQAVKFVVAKVQG
ncbi:cutinase [Aspergillus steynii IBT 23096]|uniref:Cutinase n=1 Tax=Aspergillus steynii IBT 23096 TaxID=1392250 RepID=A0A2I2FU37_9EURO|nr:cutinase [Aspergillus steynii IBT 23096]PLB44158.1 cutinase [Aspergillus steynii IBT 23096]